MALIKCSGLTRPPWPICGPSAAKRSPRLKTWPRRTQAAPRRTAPASTKFSVPRSSSAPRRPQFETFFASSRTRSKRSLRDGDRLARTTANGFLDLLAQLLARPFDENLGAIVFADFEHLRRRLHALRVSLAE